MQVEIRLVNTNQPYSITVTKDGLRTLRGSIFAQALENDPDCKEIKFENPVLKPAHLDIIKVMCEQGDLTEDDYGPPSSQDYDAAVYLNWMLLDVVCDGLIPEILTFAPNANLYKPETYGSLLPWAICQEYSSLAEHILNVTDSTHMDMQASIVCAMYKQTHIYKRLLARGIDPKTAYMPESVLRIWFGTDFCPEQDRFYEGKEYQAFRLAVGAYINGRNSQAEELIKLLLPEEGKVIQKAFELLCTHNCYSMVKIFLESTNVDPNIQVPSNDPETAFVPVLIWALENSFFHLAKALVSSPSFHISNVNRKKILHFDLSYYSSARLRRLIQNLSETP